MRKGPLRCALILLPIVRRFWRKAVMQTTLRRQRVHNRPFPHEKLEADPAVSLLRNRSKKPKVAKFPVKFPVGREWVETGAISTASPANQSGDQRKCP
jgi:hypothetical protein